jgi:hypothetical protein
MGKNTLFCLVQRSAIVAANKINWTVKVLSVDNLALRKGISYGNFS